jgi:phosphoglucosamine mutase
MTEKQAIRFGTDGVRERAGVWPIDIVGAQHIGMGVGKYLKETTEKPSVVIGRDTRISGDMLSAALSAGLLSYGVDVVDVGVMTTAGVAFLAKKHPFSMGVVISASHNPWTENGIKLIGPDGFKLKDDIELLVEQYINEACPSDIQEFGFLQHGEELVEEYIDYLVAPFNREHFRYLKVVLDCSNGAASAIAPRCFEALGSQVIVINHEPTGMNINLGGGSEVVRAGRGDLIACVLREGAHLGAAFDGDADRVVMVSEQGALVDGDSVLYLVGKHLKQIGDLPGDCVVTTEMANTGLEHALARHQIHMSYTKVGDKYVVREMIEHGYRLGGEQSGHIILLDEDHTTGDGIYTALFVSDILGSKEAPSLTAETEGMIKLPQVIASARVSSKPDLKGVEEYHQELERVLQALGDRVIVNTRYSGTEPLLRVMIQGGEGQSLEEIAQMAIRLCRSVQAHTGDLGQSLDVKDCTTGAEIKASLHGLAG